MEFPHLGHHCAANSCNQLDFLPLKCDACLRLFCKDHLTYSMHECPEAYRKNVQVPVCPLCDKPVPVSKDSSPDAVMSDHIDNLCSSDPAQERRQKIFVNKCSAKGCKKKELMPIRCDNCRQNFCVKHRIERDHHCEGREKALTQIRESRLKLFRNMGPKKSQERKSAPVQAAKSANTHSQIPATPQQTMDEDRDLALALQLSLQTNAQQAPQREGGEEEAKANESMTAQEKEDFELAKALHESEIENRRRTNNNERTASSSASASRKDCLLS